MNLVVALKEACQLHLSQFTMVDAVPVLKMFEIYHFVSFVISVVAIKLSAFCSRLWKIWPLSGVLLFEYHFYLYLRKIVFVSRMLGLIALKFIIECSCEIEKLFIQCVWWCQLFNLSVSSLAMCSDAQYLLLYAAQNLILFNQEKKGYNHPSCVPRFCKDYIVYYKDSNSSGENEV